MIDGLQQHKCTDVCGCIVGNQSWVAWLTFLCSQFRLSSVLTVTAVTCNTRFMTRIKSRRREDLLNASIEYILERGVADLSLRPLAAKVGSKARLLIYHFGTKDSLVAEAMIVVRYRVQRAFATVVGSDRGRTPSQIMQSF